MAAIYTTGRLCIARHDTIVNLLAKDIMPYTLSSERMCKHSCVSPTLFKLLNVSNVAAHSPDVVFAAN